MLRRSDIFEFFSPLPSWFLTEEVVPRRLKETKKKQSQKKKENCHMPVVSKHFGN